MKTHTWRTVCAASAIIALPLMTGCSNTASGSDDGILTLGNYPNSVLTLPVAVAEGEKLFEAEGLTVTRIDAKSGAEMVAALIGGTTQIAASSVTSAAPAMGQGQDLRVLPPFEGENKVIIATAESGITSLGDFNGKRIAVNARGSDAETYVNDVIQQGGGDPSTITYISAGGGPAVAAAVMNGQVDGAVSTLSSVEQMRANGADIKIVASPHDGTAGTRGQVGLSGFYTTTAAYYDSHPETVNSFCRALIRSTEFIADEKNKDKVVAYLADWVGLPPANAELAWAAERNSWFNTLDEGRWAANVEFAGGNPVPFDKVDNGCGQR